MKRRRKTAEKEIKTQTTKTVCCTERRCIRRAGWQAKSAAVRERKCMRTIKSALNCFRTKRASLKSSTFFSICFCYFTRALTSMRISWTVCVCECCMICIMVCDTAVLEKFIDTWKTFHTQTHTHMHSDVSYSFALTLINCHTFLPMQQQRSKATSAAWHIFV